MRLYVPYFTVAARALARVVRVLVLPIALGIAAIANAQPADPLDEPPLGFAPCVNAPSLDCGVLNVPVSYDGPSGRTVALAVARARATGPGTRLGVLFVHPGGHEAGVPWLQAGQGAPIFERMRQRFDLVSLDPRGTGSSRPLHCDFDLPDPPAGDDDATLIAYLDDFSQRVAGQCLDEDSAFVRSITGENFARDLDRLRRALGERQLSFAVFSNTGPVAASYASLFPKRVRAMIIDSPVGPEHRNYWIERRTEQGGSYERALQRVDQICTRTPGCPLEKIGVVAAFDEITARLVAQPIPLPDGGTFTANDFSTAFDVLLPRESLWMPMVGALAQGLAGDLSPFIGIVTSAGPDADDGIVARLCNDYGPRRSAADFLPIVEAAGTLHSRFLNQAYLRPDIAMCAAWPAPTPPTIRNVAKELDVPVLFFHSEFDSDAPFAWSQRLAHALGDDRHIVRYQGGGHGVISRGQPCIAETVDAYLFDLKLPKEGLSCPADVAPPGAARLAPALLGAPAFGIVSEAERSGIAPR